MKEWMSESRSNCSIKLVAKLNRSLTHTHNTHRFFFKYMLVRKLKPSKTPLRIFSCDSTILCLRSCVSISEALVCLSDTLLRDVLYT